MSLRLVVRPEAEQDLREARDWYDRQRPGLGGEFLTSVEEMFDRLCDSPQLYAVGYKGVRPARLTRFPYIVYYRTTDGVVEVLAVLHGNRHPRMWRTRA
jgi:plasmid stabilization system protein ParE